MVKGHAQTLLMHVPHRNSAHDLSMKVNLSLYRLLWQSDVIHIAH